MALRLNLATIRPTTKFRLVANCLLALTLLSGCGAVRSQNPQLINDRVEIILGSDLESSDKLAALNSLLERESDQGGNVLTAWGQLLELVAMLSLGAAAVAK